MRVCVFALGGAAVAVFAGRGVAAEEPSAIASFSASPVAIDDSALDPLEREALGRCGRGEAGLRSVAGAIVARKLGDHPAPEIDEIAQMQRTAGEPHPWARAWIASGGVPGDRPAMTRFDEWLGDARGARLRRCGVATATRPGGARVLVIVVVQALADLAPLPTRARPGEWMAIEAHLQVPARGGRVIVLGPSGAPRALLTSFDGTTLRARFAPERRGAYSVQVVADVAGGPRPVLEAAVFAGVAPSAAEEDRAAPGEDEASARAPDDERLVRMLAAARASTGVAPLARDSRLDGVARDHAERMGRSHELAHDAGDGDPYDRLRAADLDASEVGENVAHASTLALAHRAVWASPSHRANLLRREFDRVGVGVSRDERGGVWVVETFAADLR